MIQPTVAIETLGCKVNQYESSYILEGLKEAAYRTVFFTESADVYIVHSCAVTSKAAYQTRQLLRRAQRLNPLAKIVVAGCDAQLEPDRFAHERIATHILGNAEKFDLALLLASPGTLEKPFRAIGNPRLYSGCRSLPIARMQSGRSRAFLKVQDGCDTFCSYCIVPHVRGRSRSLPSDEVRRQMDRFLEYGYGEVVLTGIHLGQWGQDLAPPQDLLSLLKHLDAGPLPPRIRLSSLEPMEWSWDLLRYLSSAPWICPHFHIPLQSGHGEILRRMNRPYTPKLYSDLIDELHARFPDAAIGADVLVGFPGETEMHFNATAAITRLPLAYLHVFPFSPREGLPAALWPNRVTGAELKRRAKTLQDLGAEKRRKFRSHFIGKWVEVLVETQEKPGWWRGTTPNYLQVTFSTKDQLTAGAIMKARITRSTETGLEGEAVAKCSWY